MQGQGLQDNNVGPAARGSASGARTAVSIDEGRWCPVSQTMSGIRRSRRRDTSALNPGLLGLH